jgi:hypothetical protein
MEHTTATDDRKTTPKLSTRQDERAPAPHPITRKVPIFQRNSLSTWDMPNPWAILGWESRRVAFMTTDNIAKEVFTALN